MYRTFLQEGVGCEVSTAIWADSQEEQQMRPELQDWLRFEGFTIKDCRTGPFSE